MMGDLWVVEEGGIGRRMRDRAPPTAKEAGSNYLLSEGSEIRTESATEEKGMAMVARALAGA